MMLSDSPSTERLSPRSSKGGRPPRDISARLNDHILDVALEQFIRLGGDGATMEDIAAAARVSKRTLYTRFGSRTALLSAVVEHGIARFMHPIRRSLVDGPLRLRLLDAGQRLLDASLEPEAIGIERLVYWIADNQPHLQKQLQERSYDGPILLIQAILKDARRRGEAVIDTIEAATLVHDALVFSPRQRIILKVGLENRRSAKRAYQEEMIDLLLRGIASGDRGRGA